MEAINHLHAEIDDINAEEGFFDPAHLPSRSSTLARVIIEAGKCGDTDALERLHGMLASNTPPPNSTDPDERLAHGIIEGLAAVAAEWHHSLISPHALKQLTTADTFGQRMLTFIAGHKGCSYPEMQKGLVTKQHPVEAEREQIMRMGSVLHELGFASSQHIGTYSRWSVTPRGEKALAMLGQGAQSA